MARLSFCCSEKAVSHDYMCPGIYSAIFCTYLRYRPSKELDKRNIIFYTLCTLYILSTGMFLVDVTGFAIGEVSKIRIHHHKLSVYALTIHAGP